MLNRCFDTVVKIFWTLDFDHRSKTSPCLSSFLFQVRNVFCFEAGSIYVCRHVCVYDCWLHVGVFYGSSRGGQLWGCAREDQCKWRILSTGLSSCNAIWAGAHLLWSVTKPTTPACLPESMLSAFIWRLYIMCISQLARRVPYRHVCSACVAAHSTKHAFWPVTKWAASESECLCETIL